MSARKTAAIAIGTCGFSYKDWIGPVYPLGTKDREMLEIYSGIFPLVEIDSTYYRVPGMATFASMAQRTPDHFRFTAKVPGTTTHLRADSVHDDVRLFVRNIEPLVDAGKFACALAQFPNSFHPSPAAHEYLQRMREALGEVPLVAEFRHREWQTPETNALLHELDVGLVNVDMPHFKSLLRESSDVTSAIAYVRFHGRNVQNWWRGTNETRYDYLYTADELAPWIDRVTDMAVEKTVRDVLVFFNNHRRGQAVRNAELFEQMVDERLPGSLRRATHPERESADRPLPL